MSKSQGSVCIEHLNNELLEPKMRQNGVLSLRHLDQFLLDLTFKGTKIRATKKQID